MNISPISNSRTSFGAVQEMAAKHFLESKEFQQNEEELGPLFKEFLAEQQDKNLCFHVLYDEFEDKYFIGWLVAWSRIPASTLTTYEYQTYAPLKKSAKLGFQHVKQIKQFTTTLDETQAFGLPLYYDDIFEAGAAASQLEKTKLNLPANENSLDEKLSMRGSSYWRNYLKYCI